MFDSGKEDPAVSLSTAETEEGCLFCLSTEGKTEISRQAVEETIKKYIAFYDRFRRNDLKEDVEKTFLHAVSVMKSQVYTPEGIFRHLWTTPARYPHKKLWLWDSCYHSFGNCMISEYLAKESILALLDTQLPDGMIPHMSAPDSHSRITQPPLIAWSVEKIVRRTGDADFAGQCYDALTRYLQWDMDNRRSENGLFFWHINRDQATNRCDESGMDNCSRFDHVEEMECIDFSCFMKREADAMRYLANIMHRDGEAEKWAEYAQTLTRLINERLWDEEDRMYCDFELKTGKQHRFQSVCSFLPLFAGICSEQQKDALVASLNDPKAFRTPFPIPSISVSDPSFGTDMWCGPVWTNYVYLIAEGLYGYGENELADRIIRDAVEGVTIAIFCVEYALRIWTSDYLFPNEKEAAYHTGESDFSKAAAVFHGYGIRNVIIKAGGQGCYVSTAHEEGKLFEALPVKAVDTTGAGDNFVAGFISGLLEGETPAECCRRALIQAAKSIQHIGAVDSMEKPFISGI